jgi:hypothetical protein
MGFTILEKHDLRKMIRSSDEAIALHKLEIESDIYVFLKQEKLLKQVSDYGIFPSKYKTLNRAENIVISKFFDENFNIIEYITELAYALSLPYTLQIDCSMIIKCDKQDIPEDKSSLVISSTSDKLLESDTDSSSGDEYTSSEIFDFEQELGFTDKTELQIAEKDQESKFRYVWAQRNLCFNQTQRINSKEDMTNLLEELKSLSSVQLMRKIYELHQTQSCFDKSGFRPVRLLSTVFFLSKY